MIFGYPVTLGITIEPLKTLWLKKYDNFSKIRFYPIPNDENWTARFNREIDEDPRSVFLGYYPVFQGVNEVVNIKSSAIFMDTDATREFFFRRIDIYFSQGKAVWYAPGTNRQRNDF